MGRLSLPPPVCDTNLSQRLSFENNNNLREASFSSYLNHAEKEFVRKLAESTRDRSNSTINTTTTPEEDGDIEVFGAEKYFNGGMDSPKRLKLQPRKQQCKKPQQQMPLHPKKSKNNSSRSGTPSVRSESSWNSQNALLQNVKGNPSSRATKKIHKSSQLAKGLLYKCYCCSDKNSVKVNDETKRNPKQKQAMRAGLNFSFENSTPDEVAEGEAKNSPLKMKIQVEEQQARKSIEVFGSSLVAGKPQNVGIPNLNHIEKRLSVLTWNDIVPRVKDSNSNNLIYEDDAESDASSDLFEIESVTGDPNSFLTRQGSSCTDCVTPTTCYAPSEASIEWSVITASAADLSVMSDYDERRLSTTSPVKNMSASAAAYMIKSNYGNDMKEIQKRRSNLLMVCQSQKAVKVTEDGYGCEANVRRRSESFGRLTNFEAEGGKIKCLGSNHRLATNSLPRRYSSQISNIY